MRAQMEQLMLKLNGIFIGKTVHIQLQAIQHYVCRKRFDRMGRKYLMSKVIMNLSYMKYLTRTMLITKS